MFCAHGHQIARDAQIDNAAKFVFAEMGGKSGEKTVNFQCLSLCSHCLSWCFHCPLVPKPVAVLNSLHRARGH